MEKKEPTSKELRHFGLLTGAIAAGLFGLLLPLLTKRPLPAWPWIVAACLWAPALVYPRCLALTYRVWIGIGDVLGWINTRIILGLLFFVVIMPVGLVMRLAGKDPLRLRPAPSAASHRVPSQPPPQNHFERPF